MTSERSTLSQEQKKQLQELNYFITSELVRISQTSKSLTEFNRSISALNREVDKRFNEIIEKQTSAIALVLASVFATVFLGHIRTLLANTGIQIQTMREAEIMSNYREEIDGSFYREALQNAKRHFKKRLERDVRDIRNKFLKDEPDVAKIYKLRDAATASTEGHFSFIDEQELHRVYQAGKYESARYMYDRDIETIKVWETMEDNRVRDNPRVASHVDMQSVTIPGQELFDLVPFGQTHHPCGSGIPEQDINCRCDAVYSLI